VRHRHCRKARPTVTSLKKHQRLLAWADDLARDYQALQLAYNDMRRAATCLTQAQPPGRTCPTEELDDMEEEGRV